MEWDAMYGHAYMLTYMGLLLYLYPPPPQVNVALDSK